MDFYIQASKPRITEQFDANDECLSDAMETAFPLYTENAFVYWHHIPISLSYKYDLSYMVEDLIELFDVLTCEEQGKCEIQWLPDTFRCDWCMSWEGDQLTIQANWENLAGNVQTLLQAYPTVKIDKQDFMCEWRSVFEAIVYSLHECGYDCHSLRGLPELEKIVNRMGKSGVLYHE